MRKLVLAACLSMLSLVTATTPALAEFKTVNDLIPGMREYMKEEAGFDEVDYGKINYYFGYVIGVFDAQETRLCRSKGVTQGQILSIVNNYINAHPEQWTRPAAVVVFQALKQAFPCNR